MWASILEITRVLKPGGHAFITAPSRGHIHNVQDCWRFYPDGMRALAAWSRLELREAFTDFPPRVTPRGHLNYAGGHARNRTGATRSACSASRPDYPRVRMAVVRGPHDGLGEPRRWNRRNAAAATAAATTPLGTPREPWRRPVASRPMGELPKPKSFYDIPGFFWWLDRKVFSAVLKSQEDSPLGTLVELGAYQGKSAVIIGDHVREGERFVVVDLFGAIDGQDAANRAENERYYKTLTRQQFEHNYLALHDELPYVVQGPSSVILDHVEPGIGPLRPHRRVAPVRARARRRRGNKDHDATWRSSRVRRLPPGAHAGVAAAVWQAVFLDGLIPVALTPQKFYGVYEDPEPDRRCDSRTRRLRQAVLVTGAGGARPDRPARRYGRVRKRR